jgi:hypothetical protein
MNLPELHRKLIAAARGEAPDERVPYAFEKRIMARLAGQAAMDSWGLWGRALSRAAICCVAFMVVVGVGFHFLPASNPDNLSQDVEQTLFAAVDSNADQGADVR